MDPVQERALELRTWTFDRQLQAMVINAQNQTTLVTGNWPKGKQPDIPITGPADWDPKRKKRAEAKKKAASGQVSTAQILQAMGWMKG